MKNIFDFYKFNENRLQMDSNGELGLGQSNIPLIKYSFTFPVMKRFQLKDDGSWTYDDLYTYLRNNGVDLRQDVANEKEIDKHDVSDEDIEDYAFNYGGKRMGGWDKFKTEYGLDFEEYGISRKDYRSLQDDFNRGELDQYFDQVPSQNDKFYVEPFELYNLVVIDPKSRGDEIGTINGTFETNIELVENQIESIKGFISGQCSDGWGEGFEQQGESEKIQDLNFDTSIHPWWSEKGGKGRQWKVNINKI